MEKLLNINGLKHYNDKIQEELEEKQDNLVSGTNIKTINGKSILGQGDMEIDTKVDIKSISDDEINDLFELEDE